MSYYETLQIEVSKLVNSECIQHWPKGKYQVLDKVTKEVYLSISTNIADGKYLYSELLNFELEYKLKLLGFEK